MCEEEDETAEHMIFDCAEYEMLRFSGIEAYKYRARMLSKKLMNLRESCLRRKDRLRYGLSFVCCEYWFSTIYEDISKARAGGLQYSCCSDSGKNIFRRQCAKVPVTVVSAYCKYLQYRKQEIYNKKLTKIANINEDCCSEGSSEEDQYELGESEDSSEYSESTGKTGETEGSSDSEERKTSSICVVRRKGRELFLVLTPGDERTSIPNTSRDVMEEIEIAADGTHTVGDETASRKICG
ncbi:hypothetical protein K0M31_002640 [Melipona bicolor]|uniref:Uncharacterized protein n=1 Tax=Melipona bicolor TaxID=60889 RepID=A0AA40GII9_9HYME|nr:hypothetical protein K0M31_002640 [Melipona bicolor]